MSTPETSATTVTPETNTEKSNTPESTATTVTPETNTEKSNTPESTATTVTPETVLKNQLEILDETNALCNTVLYCLTKGFYPGADAHLVNQSKEFVKAIKYDVESKRKQLVNGQSVELGK